jgi:hypothetical protein
MRLTPAWDRFWFGPLDPRPAAAFRVALGTLIAANFLCLYPNWIDYFSTTGIAGDSGDRWTLFYWLEPLVGLRPLWWAGFVSAIGFAAGRGTRWWAVALFGIQASMCHSNRMVVNGEDLVFRMFLFYACFTDLDGNRPASAWPIRLMQVNFVLIYLISVPFKLHDDAAWRNGEAVYWAVANETWSRWPWPSLFYEHGAILSRAATAATLLVEAGFAPLVCFSRTRLCAVAALIILHLGIAAALKNVTFFSLSMACGALLFLPPGLLRRPEPA